MGAVGVILRGVGIIERAVRNGVCVLPPPLKRNRCCIVGKAVVMLDSGRQHETLRTPARRCSCPTSTASSAGCLQTVASVGVAISTATPTMYWRGRRRDRPRIRGGRCAVRRRAGGAPFERPSAQTIEYANGLLGAAQPDSVLRGHVDNRHPSRTMSSRDAGKMRSSSPARRSAGGAECPACPRGDGAGRPSPTR